VRLGLVWAQARGGVIGKEGGMPWHVPEDLAHFRAVTTGAPVIMGRRTWESFPPASARSPVVATSSSPGPTPGPMRGGRRFIGCRIAPRRGADGVGDRRARLFVEALPRADVLEVTELDLEVDGRRSPRCTTAGPSHPCRRKRGGRSPAVASPIGS
jgi:dihydrofolate reductase